MAFRSGSCKDRQPYSHAPLAGDHGGVVGGARTDLNHKNFQETSIGDWRQAAAIGVPYRLWVGDGVRGKPASLSDCNFLRADV